MDGIHDLGGMQGFGSVAHSPAKPAFPDRWQAVARALMAVVAGAVQASGGEFRHSIERMEPGHYLTSSYYEHWLTAAATLAVEHGLVTRAELEGRAGGRPVSGPVLGDTCGEAVQTSRRPASGPATTCGAQIRLPYCTAGTAWFARLRAARSPSRGRFGGWRRRHRCAAREITIVQGCWTRSRPRETLLDLRGVGHNDADSLAPVAALVAADCRGRQVCSVVDEYLDGSPPGSSDTW